MDCHNLGHPNLEVLFLINLFSLLHKSCLNAQMKFRNLRYVQNLHTYVIKLRVITPTKISIDYKGKFCAVYSLIILYLINMVLLNRFNYLGVTNLRNSKTELTRVESYQIKVVVSTHLSSAATALP